MPAGQSITRRDFAKTALLLTAGATLPGVWSIANAADAPQPSGNDQKWPRYRAISWWLVWEDLSWPNPELMDKIRRRADQCAASQVNCCMIFGAHFRWDFMPLWSRLHDELHFIADELHQRKIQLFDHHSCVLTHRPRNREEAMNIWRRNRHHVPFYPSLEEAATLRFNGSLVNDWRMLDVETGAPVYLPTYNAEQYCMNNPAFREAYGVYVKEMLSETGVDGLMSDDCIYYGGWRACACQHCRARFQREYGHDLPPVSDTTFWGNRHSEAFRDWITMRFKSSGDFLGSVKASLPKEFPLLSCCSSSDGFDLPSSGMTYQEFIRSCNLVMLEMTGSTPSLTGDWDNRIPSELLHLGIARDHHAPCLGLGYAFFPDTAFFVWTVNKFLGCDTWLSTLKGRLDATPEELTALADDPELAGEGFRWEQEHPHLFTGQADTDVAVFFSRATRDYYRQVAGDYSADYAAGCLALMRAGVSCEVVTEIPEFGRWRRLVLSSVVCLSAAEKAALEKFITGGGTIVATGPTGHYDERANPVSKAWLENFGVHVELIEPERPGGFPPYDFKKLVEITQCHVIKTLPMHNGWFETASRGGKLYWRPERISGPAVVNAVVQLLRAENRPVVQLEGLPAGWRLRQYRDGQRLLIHALPGQVETVLSDTLKNQLTGERIIEKLKYTPLDGNLVLKTQTPVRKVTLYSPDLAEAREGRPSGGMDWSVATTDVSRYFVVECLF